MHLGGKRGSVSYSVLKACRKIDSQGASSALTWENFCIDLENIPLFQGYRRTISLVYSVI